MFKYIIWAIVFYCMIRFIFNFLIPVIRASRRMRQQMRAFQNNMQQQQFQEKENAFTSRQQHPGKTTAGDYIDFEEVK